MLMGVILGILLFFSPGTSFLLFSGLISCFFIRLLPENSERKLLMNIFLAALISRILAVLLVMFFAIVKGKIVDVGMYGFPGTAPYIFYDSGYYTLRAFWMSSLWTGVNLGETAKLIASECGKFSYGFNGFLNVLAIFFSFLGYSPISSIFINCFLGTISAILVYFSAKEIFGFRVARLSAIFMVVFPSLFLWSITNLKDTCYIFLVCLMLWSFTRFVKSKNLFYIVLLFLSVWLQSYFHKQLLNITMLILLFSLFYLFITSVSYGTRTIIILTTILTVFLLVILNYGSIGLLIKKNLQDIYISHKGFITTGGACYKLLPGGFYDSHDTITGNEFIKMLGKGWLHLMFEPFPWRLESKSLLFAFFQMIFVYMLTPFAILGMFITVKSKLRESILFVVFFIIVGSILAVTEGNIGTTFRHRDMLTPIFLIFSSIGIVRACNAQTGSNKQTRLPDNL
ncbi:MAG: glycosyltransferase family 39 protein [Candidatus Omnitrophota bacterium]